MSANNGHEVYMRRALQLARCGEGNTSPNPMVGAVVVDRDGRIIGEGYHRRCGEGHAEVNAIASVKDKSALSDSTIYVTLEPCSHYGKTPPCAQLIIDSKIPRVVVGAGDPFKEVAGRGIAMLRNAGIEVTEGVLETECRDINRKFMTAHTLQRPYITLKWAQSADGFMDSDRADGHPAKFSTPLTQTLVHRLRSLHDAIDVGSGTVVADRPRLDCRLWPGRSPLPVVMDRSGRIDPSSLCMARDAMVLSDYADLNDAMHTLYRRGVTSLLVEGGPTLLQSFIDAGLWDSARIETAPLRLGSHGRAKAPVLDAAPQHTDIVDGNTISVIEKDA